LRLAVFDEVEVGLLEAVDDVALCVGDDDVEDDGAGVGSDNGGFGGIVLQEGWNGFLVLLGTLDGRGGLLGGSRGLLRDERCGEQKPEQRKCGAENGFHGETPNCV